MIRIKEMQTLAELQGKAKVHSQTFRETYGEILPSDYLAGIHVEKCLEWARAYPRPTLLSLDGDEVIGFAVYGMEKGIGEIFALYLLKAYQGQKIGYQLMEAACRQLSSCSEIILWVLEGNEKAISFYQKYGFVMDGGEERIFMGKEVLKKRMIYRRQSI